MPFRIKTEAKKTTLEPQEILEWYERFGDWVVDHAKPLIIFGAVAAVVALAWGGLAWKSHRAEAGAARLQATALDAYQQAFEAGKHQRIVAPETRAGYEQSIAGFQRVIDEYPATTQAAFARFYLGNAHAALDHYDQAIPAYLDFLRDPGAATELVPFVTQRLAYTLWLKGQPQDALGSFEQILKMPKAPNRDQAYFETGRILEQQGEKPKALETYSKLATEYPSSPWTSEAVARITALGGTPPLPSSGAAQPPIQEPSASPVPGNPPQPPQK